MAIKIEKHTAAPWTSSGPATVTTASSTSCRRPETVASQKKVGVIEDYKPHVPRRHHRSRAGHSGHHWLRRRHGEARTRRRVRVPCAEGDTGRIYKGLLKFEKTQTDAGVLPEVGMKIMLNAGNPELAFTFGQLPSDGIGPV